MGGKGSSTTATWSIPGKKKRGFGYAAPAGLAPSAARKLSILLFALLMTAVIPAVMVRDVRLSIPLVSLATLGYTGGLASMGAGFGA